MSFFPIITDPTGFNCASLRLWLPSMVVCFVFSFRLRNVRLLNTRPTRWLASGSRASRPSALIRIRTIN